MRVFRTPDEASRFMQSEIDQPTPRRSMQLGKGILFEAFPLPLGAHTFTNVYDVSWDPKSVSAGIHIPAQPTSVQPFMGQRGTLAAASGAFFFLADRASAMPRQATLNLVASGGEILSVPVSDRETLVCQSGRLSLRYVQARGVLQLNGSQLNWEGTRTGRLADCYVYGNGNSEILRKRDEVTGTARVLAESSRYTTALSPQSEWVDVAFQREVGTNGYVSTAAAPEGRMDLFSADLVVRVPRSVTVMDRPNALRILSVGPFAANGLPESALSVGPSLAIGDVPSHPTNRDLSLGDNACFSDGPLARMTVFQTKAGRVHLRLFDGRPGSGTFAGPTPSEASAAIRSTVDVDWGCFMDGGQTARICVQEGESVTSYGNRHYLRWPKNGEGDFVWTPDEGRPVGSVITLF
ncbi:hypothetical protein [Streptomyces sp. NPDC002845]